MPWRLIGVVVVTLIFCTEEIVTVAWWALRGSGCWLSLGEEHGRIHDETDVPSLRIDEHLVPFLPLRPLLNVGGKCFGFG